MIKKLLSIAIIILTSTNAISQSDNPTTEIEYNYITNGYKIQKESGLDMKVGYSFMDMNKVTIGTYTYDVKALIRNEKFEIAGLMVVTTSSSWGNTYYFCIPIGNSELNERYFNQLNTWDKAITTPYAYMISTNFSSILAKYFELEKKLRE